MATTILRPAPLKPSFRSSDGLKFYCDRCSSYTPNFSQVFVKRGHRLCTPCYEQNGCQLPHVDHRYRLRRKLYKALHARGHGALARGLTNDSIDTILKLHSVQAEAVKRIVAPVASAELPDLTKYDVLKTCNAGAIAALHADIDMLRHA